MKNVFAKVGVIAAIVAVCFLICQILCCCPINIHSTVFILECLVISAIIAIIFLPEDDYGMRVIGPIAIVLIIVVVLFVVNGPMISIKNYKDRTNEQNVELSDVEKFSTSQVQLVDKNTAINLGDRQFGILGSEKVSQFNVSNEYTQIVKNGKLFRVTPIEFGGLFSQINNKQVGALGYIVVDCETGQAEVVSVNGGMRYLKEAFFGLNLRRRLFFFNPSNIYGESKFEIDENGSPYWVTPVYKVSNFGRIKEVIAIVLTNPVTGECAQYSLDKVPTWIDNVYPVENLYNKFKTTYKYQYGFWNFSHKGVVEFTDDYSYMQMNGTLFIYTGITSVGNDESNVGFAYVNLHTGEYRIVNIAGAEEYSARTSAEGLYQQYGYKAIFPTLVNINEEPVYFMGLVDNGNLIKAYAFVNYQNYQIVGAGETVERALSAYTAKVGVANETIKVEGVEIEASEIRIEVSNEGTTIYIIATDGTNYTITKK